MGLFSRKSAKPEKLLYGSLQWDAVMFRDWPELRLLPYWRRFRRDARMQGDEGRVYVTEYTDLDKMLIRRPEGTSRHMPEPYKFAVVLPDGTPLTAVEGVELGALVTSLTRGLPPEAVLLRHATGMWPLFYVDIMRNAGEQLNAMHLQLSTAAPRRHR